MSEGSLQLDNIIKYDNDENIYPIDNEDFDPNRVRLTDEEQAKINDLKTHAQEVQEAEELIQQTL